MICRPLKVDIYIVDPDPILFGLLIFASVRVLECPESLTFKVLKMFFCPDRLPHQLVTPFNVRIICCFVILEGFMVGVRGSWDGTV